MVRSLYIALSVWCLLGGSWRLTAAAPAETRAYDVARRFFNTRAFEVAERELETFLRQYPKSEFSAEVVLLLAQSRFELGRYSDVLELLSQHQPLAGPLADQYLFWEAESLFRAGRLEEAVRAYQKLIADFPASSRRSESVVAVALAFQSLERSGDALAWLDRHEALLREALGSGESQERNARGLLVHAELLLSAGQWDRAAESLARLETRRLPPLLEWERVRSLARLELNRGQARAAWPLATNLVRLARELGAAPQFSEAVLLQGDVQEKLDEAGSALATWELLLGTNTPAMWRLEAMSRIMQVAIGRGQVEDGIRRGELFLGAESVTNRALAPIRYRLAELQLKAVYAQPLDNRAAATNRLLLAQALFQQVVSNQVTGWSDRAELGRGWCFWEQAQGSTNQVLWDAAEEAFAAASFRLAGTDEEAIARFKWGDCQLKAGRAAASITNYQFVLDRFTDRPAVRDSLFEAVRYQLLRAALVTGDLTIAEASVRALVAEGKASERARGGLLLFGQALAEQRRPEEARAILREFADRFPQSDLKPVADVAIAAGLVTGGDWKGALAAYDAWLAQHGDHPLRLRVEFDRGWSAASSGETLVAFQAFSNFVVRFPTNALTPWAENWLADHYRNQNELALAEDKYQRIFKNTNWPPSALTFRAQLMAGRMAFARQNWKDARGYFTNLVNQVARNADVPKALIAEGWFLLGDTIYHQYLADPSAGSDLGSEAISAFSQVTQRFGEEALAPRAWGRMADCYFQLGARDPLQYDRALQAYTNALIHARGTVLTRSAAECGLGLVHEKRALLASGVERGRLQEQALAHYLSIVEGKNLREGERADPFWVKEAGLAAARLVEEGQRWDVAIRIYEQLERRVPSLSENWRARLALARTNLARLERTITGSGTSP